MIEYVLEQELENRLPGRSVVTVLTQVVVDPEDPAFQHPTKPIGQVYTEEQARELAQQNGWSIAPDNEHFRRVVASPEPIQIVELSAIRLLVDSGALVVCTGGGGIPVVRDVHDRLHGIEAVIDKDLAGELLARSPARISCSMLTDVDAVVAGWSTPEARPIRHATVAELRALDFAAGSMKPKVELHAASSSAPEAPPPSARSRTPSPFSPGSRNDDPWLTGLRSFPTRGSAGARTFRAPGGATIEP